MVRVRASGDSHRPCAPGIVLIRVPVERLTKQRYSKYVTFTFIFTFPHD